MRNRFIHFWLACLCLASASTLLADNPYRILVTGDSISVGYTDNPDWTVPFNFGARSGLYTRLTNSGMNFQFVGNSPEPWNGTFGLPTNTPTLDLRPLGQDHCEGYGGKKASFILGNISGWLAAESPDIVLLMIGINDIHADVAEPTATEATLSNIVLTVTAEVPNARLIVAQITPYGTNCPAIVKYNTYIRDVLVPYFVGQGKHVTTVNQYTNLCFPGTTNIDGSLFANGINHPMPAVYDKMAQTWFEGIQALLPLPPPGTPPPSSSSKWSGAISGVWDTSTTNWAELNAGTPTTYTDSTPGDSVQFDDTLVGNPAITLTNVFMPASVTFANSTTAYSLSGSGAITGSGEFTKTGTNSVTVATTNEFTGGVTVSDGTLVIKNAAALGTGTKNINVKSSFTTTGARAELHLDGSSGPITLPANFSISGYCDQNSTSIIVNEAGNNVIEGPISIPTGGGHFRINVQGGSLTLKGPINNARPSSNRILYLDGSGTNFIEGVVQNNPGAPTVLTYITVWGGNWTLSNSNNTYTGQTLVATNGTLIVTGQITNSPYGLIVQNGGTLQGTGVIYAATTNQAGSVLAPGPAVGTLTINNNLMLQGTAVMEIARNGAVLTNDLVTGITTITCGGALIVTNVGGSPLHVGDAFKLFAATNYAGTFANIVYPAGYTFSNGLAVDGKITVLTVPVTTPPNFPAGGLVKLPDGNFSLMATGAVGGTYRLWASTNVALSPVTNLWTLVTNGTIGASPFTIIDGAATNYPQRFYQFSTP